MSGKSSFQIVIVRNDLEKVAAELHMAASEIVAQTAKDIADVYTDTAPRATGFMASSAYYVTHDTSTYGDLVGGADGPMLPEVEKPANDQEAYAAVAAEYAAFVELGTSKMAAQPAFAPAVDTAAAQFAHELENIEKRVKE